MFNFTAIANYAKVAGCNETFGREPVRSGEPPFMEFLSALPLAHRIDHHGRLNSSIAQDQTFCVRVRKG